MSSRVTVVGDASSINVRRWCEGLASGGMTVSMISFEPAWCDEIPVERPRGALAGHRARYLAAIPSARRIAASQEPDLVIGYFVSGYGTIARGVGLHPLVQVTAGLDVVDNPRGSLRHRITRKNLLAADLVIAWGDHMRDAVEEFGVDRDQVMVQPRGIPIDHYTPRTRSSAGPFRAIVTRALEPVYRHSEILRAVAHTDPSEIAELTIVGDGSLREPLERLTRELAIADRVRFVGRVPNDDLPPILEAHDFYLSARPHDGVSASLLEAMAAGLVPIVPDHPANRGWIEDGANGLLVEPEHESLTGAIRRAMSDPELRRAAATKNPEIVRCRGDLASNMQRFVDVFGDLIRR